MKHFVCFAIAVAGLFAVGGGPGAALPAGVMPGEGVGVVLTQICANIWAMKSVTEVSDWSKQENDKINEVREMHAHNYNIILDNLIAAEASGKALSKEIDGKLPDAILEAGKAGLNIDLTNFSAKSFLQSVKGTAGAGAKGVELLTLEEKLRAADANVEKAKAQAFLALLKIAVFDEARANLSECVQDQIAFLKSRTPLAASAMPLPPVTEGFGLPMSNMSPEDSAQMKGSVTGNLHGK